MVQAPFKIEKGNALQSAMNAVGQAESGAINEWSGGGGAWCQAFLCAVTKESGSKALEGFKGTASVSAMWDYGKTNSLMKDAKKEGLKPGDWVAFHERGGKFTHVAQVASVDGDKFTLIHGNWGNKVAHTKTHKMSDFGGKFDPIVVSAEKMDALSVAKGGIAVFGTGQGGGIQPTQSQIASNNPSTLTAPNFNLPSKEEISKKLAENKNDKTPLTSTYNEIAEKNQNALPMFFQLLVAALLAVSGKSNLIPTTQDYAKNSGAGTQALAKADQELQKKQSIASVPTIPSPLTSESIGGLPSPNTPNVLKTPTRQLQPS
jgi:CHAP domain